MAAAANEPNEPSPQAEFRRELRALLQLALPVVICQVGTMTLNLVDVAMVGHFAPGDAAARKLALDAASLGSIYTITALAFAIGVLYATDPLFSQAIGAKDRGMPGRIILRGTALVALLTIPTAVVLCFADEAFTQLRQPPSIQPDAADYARINIAGVLPYLLFNLLRNFVQAHGRVRKLVAVVVVANLVNVVLDLWFIGGGLGLRAHGVQGAGWATVGTRWAMFLVLAWLAAPMVRSELRDLREWKLTHPHRRVIAAAPLWRMLRLGAPAGVQALLEVGIFSATGFFVGAMGTGKLGGHQVALMLAATTFMVPVGISVAAAVRVGNAIGAQDMPRARLAGRASVLTSMVVMCVFTSVFILAPGVLAGAFTDAPETIAIAASLIPIAGVFQIFDGLQVTAIGILRGTGDTRTPMVANLLGFWVLGLPAGYYLGTVRGLGPAGYWWGLVVGLGTVAMLLLLRTRATLRQDIVRLNVD